MLILGIDASAKTASVGIMDNERMIVNFTLNHKRTHSEKLLEMIDMALNIAKCDISDIDAFAVCKGPGSFTGLRIGLSTVKGLCHALNKPCFLTSTLSMLYENVKGAFDDGALYVPVMDARRNEVYTAIFKDGEKILPDSAMPIFELMEIIDKTDADGKVVFVGDGVSPNLDIIKDHFKDRVAFADECHNYGSGYSVITSALKENEEVSYDKIQPSYLRVSQAERMKKEK